MPGNTIQINHSKELECYVGDSQMDNLIEYLDEKGFRTSNDKEESTISSDASS